jgi:phosphopantothenoylcysteine decarboxylase/phosphopantothenate--cysteine ligase
MSVQGKPCIVLGVSGSVAAYRAADIARELMRSGFVVRACLTDAAQNFVTPALFEALTGQPCLISAFEEPDRGRMAHIDWARQADVLLIAPASANTIAKLAHGIADDMLSTIATAYTGPIVVAPAMNPSMYASETTRAAMGILRSRAAAIVEPTEGDVACGEQGQGKLASIDQIVKAVVGIHGRSQSLQGKKVLITSGPTQEPIDSVRFLTNRSSGKMGSALARAALLMGAEVTVVAGPQHEPLPLGAKVIRVTTAEQMMLAALPEAPEADIVIGAAAVADYHVAKPVQGKIRRNSEPLSLDLVPNPDVLAEIKAAARPDALIIGFAAEPDAGQEAAVDKIRRKGLHAIAVNDISKTGVGFDADDNELNLIFGDGRSESSGRVSKLHCALWLLERIAVFKH